MLPDKREYKEDKKVLADENLFPRILPAFVLVRVGLIGEDLHTGGIRPAPTRLLQTDPTDRI